MTQSAVCLSYTLFAVASFVCTLHILKRRRNDARPSINFEYEILVHRIRSYHTQEYEMGIVYTELFEMTVGVLTTSHLVL